MVLTAETGQRRPAPYAPGARWYGMFGLRVLSDFPLPVAEIEAPNGLAANLKFRRASAGATPGRPTDAPSAVLTCAHGRSIVGRFDRPDGAWIWDYDIATFWVSSDGATVEVYPEPGTDERLLALLLVGQIPVIVLQQRGFTTLHASAVVTPSGAVAFLGKHGQGKSTMAAGFLRRGASLLTDDVLPLAEEAEEIRAAPGAPLVKLWDETAQWALGLPRETLDLLPNTSKRLISASACLRLAASPVRLRALYLLERFDAEQTGSSSIEIQRLNRRDALLTLVAQTSWSGLLPPRQAARNLSLFARLTAQAPVSVLKLPSGEEHLDAIHERVMTELEPS